MMRFLLSTSLLLSLFLSGFQPLKGQACTAYERELQEYFLAYQPENLINIHQIETVRNQCPRPTAKLELLYFYFRAMNARLATGQTDYQAYEGATFFYDQSAKYFDYLITAPASEDTFVETFFARAHELEQWLQKEARRLRVTPQNRYYGTLGEEDDLWQRSELPEVGTELAENSRGQQDSRIVEFQRKYYQRGQYVDQLFAGGMRGQDGYPAANARTSGVGFLGDLNFLDYLEWTNHQSNQAQVSSPVANGSVLRSDGSSNWRVGTPVATTTDLYVQQGSVYRSTGMATSPAPIFSYEDPAAWVDRLNTKDLSYWSLAAVREGAPVFATFGPNAGILTTLNFGQVLAQAKPGKSVKVGTQTYLLVRTQAGQQGYVDLTDVAQDGQLVVITKTMPAYTSVNERADRQAVMLQAGELVVTDGTSNSWIRLLGRDGKKRGWVMGFDGLSSDIKDVQIGQQLYLALLETNLDRRRQRLNDLRSIPGVGQSALVPVIQRYLSESGF